MKTGLLLIVLVIASLAFAENRPAPCDPDVMLIDSANLKPLKFQRVITVRLNSEEFKHLLSAPKALLERLDIHKDSVSAKKGHTLLYREGFYLIYPGVIQELEPIVYFDVIFDPGASPSPGKVGWAAYVCACPNKLDDTCQFEGDELLTDANGVHAPPCGGEECCRTGILGIGASGNEYLPW